MRCSLRPISPKRNRNAGTQRCPEVVAHAPARRRGAHSLFEGAFPVGGVHFAAEVSALFVVVIVGLEHEAFAVLGMKCWEIDRSLEFQTEPTHC